MNKLESKNLKRSRSWTHRELEIGIINGCVINPFMHNVHYGGRLSDGWFLVFYIHGWGWKTLVLVNQSVSHAIHCHLYCRMNIYVWTYTHNHITKPKNNTAIFLIEYSSDLIKIVNEI